MKMINQQRQYKQDKRVNDMKNKITAIGHQCHKDILKNLKNRLSEHQRRFRKTNRDSRASVRISCLPLEHEDCTITKQLF